MNHHLQLFRFFSESEDSFYIEKNLTRAFALCLKNDNILMYAFMSEVLTADDFNYLFLNPAESAEIQVDIEVETARLVDNTKTLYAIGITEMTEKEDWSLEEDINAEESDKRNYTDIVISVKDVTIIIEAKRTKEDCREQLKGQVSVFRTTPTRIVGSHLPWLYVLELLKKVSNFNLLSNRNNSFLLSFQQLIERRFNNWISTTAFKHISIIQAAANETVKLELNKRLNQSMRSLGDEEIAFFSDRVAIKLKQPWASEGIPGFDFDPQNPKLIISIWPGNTKQQGYSLYRKSFNWTTAKRVNVGEKFFDIKVLRHIKFMHFNKYRSSIDIPVDDTNSLNKEINTPHNFHNFSGRWDRGKWSELEEFLSEHIRIDWKDKAEWSDQFESSNRTYLTMSLGYKLSLEIPYQQLQAIDTSTGDYKKVGLFLKDCLSSMERLIEEG